MSQRASATWLISRCLSLSHMATAYCRAYDLKKKVEVGCLLQHDGKITDLEFASNGKWAVSAATDGKLVLWRTQVGITTTATATESFVVDAIR